MNISDNGLRLVKSFEGYHTRQKDGSCAAYLCPAGVATIGWGCTEGVKLGMTWTEAEAEAGLRRELAKFEAGVARCVTVDLNQNEFDALVSLSYNIGLAGFQKSSVLRKLNADDRDGAAAAFALWNKGGGRVLKGLVSRREREAALFRKPVAEPDEPFMPQRVEQSAVPPSRKIVAVGTSAVTAGGAVIAENGIPPPPVVVDHSTSALAAWKSLVFKSLADPLLLGGLAIVAAVFVVPWVLDKWRAA